MTEYENTSRDFNLFLSSEAIFAILEALYELMGEIPEGEPELCEFYAKLSGLSWCGKLLAQEQRKFLECASDLHRVPATYRDIRQSKPEVREQFAIYVVQ